jgi:hypothetical protein
MNELKSFEQKQTLKTMPKLTLGSSFPSIGASL